MTEAVLPTQPVTLPQLSLGCTRPHCILVSPPNPPASHLATVSEEQCLYQIYIDELYGGLQRPSEDEKKK